MIHKGLFYLLAELELISTFLQGDDILGGRGNFQDNNLGSLWVWEKQYVLLFVTTALFHQQMSTALAVNKNLIPTQLEFHYTRLSGRQGEAMNVEE